MLEHLYDINKALKHLRKLLKKGGKENEGGGGLGDMAGAMEETEKELVNKNITQETINRQREILTRLLEAEKALNEREYDNEREGEQAKEKTREVPPGYEEYIKAKEKQVEELRMVDPNLSPFYKKEVNRYFRNLNK